MHSGPDVGTLQTKCSRGSTKIRKKKLPFAKSSINQTKVQNSCIFFFHFIFSGWLVRHTEARMPPD